jgi:hypothetical protein
MALDSGIHDRNDGVFLLSRAGQGLYSVFIFKEKLKIMLDKQARH